MKLIEPNVQEITDFEGVDNFYKAVARAARICYASDKTTDDKKLCAMLIEKKHFSPFEHAIVYIPLYGEIRKWIDENKDSEEFKIIDWAKYSKYITSDYNEEKQHYELSINGRILVESVIKYSDDYMKSLENVLAILKRFELNKHWFKSFIVDTSIGCTREMNRHHDNFYIVEQSTRYCNFSKDKFGNEVAFNKPYWYDTASKNKRDAWEFAMRQAEYNYINNQYMFSIDEIRGVLPLDTHTRAIYTATLEEWQHIIDLRLKGTTGKPHGDIMIIADKIDKLIHHK